MGTMFTIYDHGENPKKASAIGEAVRLELGAVIYVIPTFSKIYCIVIIMNYISLKETNVLGLKGPRKMTIIIPGIKFKYNFT
jgi:hypothetical protein